MLAAADAASAIYFQDDTLLRHITMSLWRCCDIGAIIYVVSARGVKSLYIYGYRCDSATPPLVMPCRAADSADADTRCALYYVMLAAIRRYAMF